MGWGRGCAKFYCRRGDAQRARSRLFQLQTGRRGLRFGCPPRLGITSLMLHLCWTQEALKLNAVLNRSLCIDRRLPYNRPVPCSRRDDIGVMYSRRPRDVVVGRGSRLGSSHKKQTLTGDRTGRGGSLKWPTSSRTRPAAMASRGLVDDGRRLELNYFAELLPLAWWESTALRSARAQTNPSVTRLRARRTHTHRTKQATHTTQQN